MTARSIVLKLQSQAYALRKRAADDTEERRAAYEAQLEHCWNSLWRYAYHCSDNLEDANDLLGETILEGFKSFDQFRGDTTFLRWMQRIMATTRIDMYRKNLRHKARSLDAMLDADNIEFADPGGSPEQLVVDSVMSEPVHRALTQLPEEFRSVVVLADMEQLNYTEVSQVLQIPMGTVRSRLFRARALMRAALADDLPGDYRLRGKALPKDSSGTPGRSKEGK